MSNELWKTAQGVTQEEAQAAVGRLRKLEESKPTGGELARGALAGAVVGPAATTVSQVIAGQHPLSLALAEPRAAGRAALGKAVRKGLVNTTRGLGGLAASGAVFGAGLPIIRRQLDRKAEIEKLKGYLGQSEHGPVRSQVRQTLGVG